MSRAYNPVISTRVSPELKEKLQDHLRRKGITLSEFIRQALDAQSQLKQAYSDGHLDGELYLAWLYLKHPDKFPAVFEELKRSVEEEGVDF